MKELAESNVVIALIGTKLDLCENDPKNRAVSKAEAEKFAKNEGILFFETSSLSDFNVNSCFENVVER